MLNCLLEVGLSDEKWEEILNVDMLTKAEHGSSEPRKAMMKMGDKGGDVLVKIAKDKARKDALKHEAGIYNRPLSTLENKVIQRFYGYYEPQKGTDEEKKSRVLAVSVYSDPDVEYGGIPNEDDMIWKFPDTM